VLSKASPDHPYRLPGCALRSGQYQWWHAEYDGIESGLSVLQVDEIDFFAVIVQPIFIPGVGELPGGERWHRSIGSCHGHVINR
jgi:hypothetical protein